ncbi:hypothetical protein HPB52_010584 [Rhipicephalus sanguineus]|uniref:Uncharacterized protein n=1 Tax=Rhipicephalus sanguineus TaxID=34632 RepID=A0A9D4PFM6_RHISA|nr:hypothetical protein HPB52_010584 [Rhipicephalus sanguineus]
MTDNRAALALGSVVGDLFKKEVKKATFSICVGHVNMSADELAENVKATEAQLLERLMKGWDHVHTLFLKSTMGPAFKLC